jgi:hypothetical protein
MVQVDRFLRIWGPIPNLFGILGGKWHCCDFFMTVLVFLDHASLVMDTKELEFSTRSTTTLSVNGVMFGLPFIVVHDPLLCFAQVEGEVVFLAPHCSV